MLNTAVQSGHRGLGGRVMVVVAGQIVGLMVALPAAAQSAPAPGVPAAAVAVDKAAAEVPLAERVKGSIPECIGFLVGGQEGGEGDALAEWPYEGVYRVRGQIPIGYRIGGTSIVCVALLHAPGFAADEARKSAVERSLKFVTKALHEPLMNPDYEGGYDVRGWGYTYALNFLLAMKSTRAVDGLPEDLKPTVDEHIKWCIDAIQQTEINEAGGWNYARAPGKKTVCPTSPFMTGPTLQGLFEARAQGFAVETAVVDRALKALERGRAGSGSVAYAGDAKEKRPEKVPGSVGRMLAAEVTLYLAGRSDVGRVRGAIDSFLVHWEWLDKRRAKNGTHEGPYGIAPYYFYYAHNQAAQAIELLPKDDRAEYRRRLYERLFSVKLENGTWNDRVFPRTASYGTSQALMVLLAPELPEMARWGVAAGVGDGVKKGE